MSVRWLLCLWLMRFCCVIMIGWFCVVVMLRSIWVDDLVIYMYWIWFLMVGLSCIVKLVRLFVMRVLLLM